MRYLALAFTLLSTAASAHAFLTHADPAVGSTVAAPTSLTLSYTEGVEAPFCKVTVTAPDGSAVSGTPAAVPGHDDELTVPLHITAPGKYVVIWHAVAVDTHKTEGSFSFTVTNG
jgi:methionine-rich copper-binding protein CopC